MKAIAFAACCGTLVSCISIDSGMAQTSPARPQVFSIAGTTVMLPRQAGSKDAPDIPLAPPITSVEPERSGSPITEMASPGRRAKR